MNNLDNVFGKPAKYKNIKIYPVKIKDSIYFNNNIGCLTINKNKIQDVNIIKMSYLMFLYYAGYQMPELINMLHSILTMVFKDQKYDIKFDNETLFIEINNVKINEYEFDIIKNIICKQNLILLNDKILDPDLEARLKEAEDFLLKKDKSATLEERIIAYHCVTGLSYDEIKNLTIYQFNKGLERMQLIKNFEVYTYPLLKSGSGDQIQNWLSHIEDRNIYDHVLMKQSEFDKITNDGDVFKK